jgi:biopolymer transport protein ExbD
MRRRSRRHKEPEKDLDITPLLNLVVTLIPFLLVSTVFTQIGVHNLNMPEISSGPGMAAIEQLKKPLVLEVVLYKNRLELLDRQTGPLKSYPNVDGVYNHAALTQTLKAVKLRFPEVTEITVLMEKDTPYQHLIATMDAVRSTKQVQDGRTVKVDLFPDISIGDAPPDNPDYGTPPAAAPQAGPSAALQPIMPVMQGAGGAS